MIGCKRFFQLWSNLSFSIKGGGNIKRNMHVNHLRNGYSAYVFSFFKKHIKSLDTEMKIGDIGAGHLRNLKLFEELGFKNLYAMDREKTDNPLKVNLKRFVLQALENGIPFPDRFFDITLCNFVLMFIEDSKIEYVLDELMRVTNVFLIIETNKKRHTVKNKTFHKDYDFNHIVNYLKKNPDFEILQVKKSHEKIKIRRKTDG